MKWYLLPLIICHPIPLVPLEMRLHYYGNINFFPLYSKIPFEFKMCALKFTWQLFNGDRDAFVGWRRYTNRKLADIKGQKKCTKK